ncbi:MAG: inorganic diphosphatase, partial [Verrucomicrobiota bacterium]|nr:inorganic diphosphatase [Verrucomicrobiota bacterium]
TENGKTLRNDRLIAVAEKSRRHEHVRELGDLPKQLLSEIEHFFASYNEIKGKRFEPLGRFGPARALELVAQASSL